MESFGFESDVQGLFSEVSEVEMIDVIGGQCGLKPSFLLEKKYEKLFLCPDFWGMKIAKFQKQA